MLFQLFRCCVQVLSVQSRIMVLSRWTWKFLCLSACQNIFLNLIFLHFFLFCSSSSLSLLYFFFQTLLFFLCLFSIFSPFLSLHFLSSLLIFPFQQTDRQTGRQKHPGFDHMPVEDRPRLAVLFMQGKPWAPTFGKSWTITRPFSPPPPLPLNPLATAPRPPPTTIPPRVVLIMAASIRSCNRVKEKKILLNVTILNFDYQTVIFIFIFVQCEEVETLHQETYSSNAILRRTISCVLQIIWSVQSHSSCVKFCCVHALQRLDEMLQVLNYF